MLPHTPLTSTPPEHAMIDNQRLPQHIAIIMDGNGRWAQARGMVRSKGHQAGVEAVDKITSECSRLGIRFLTLYTFSTENWNRPPEEVNAIMQLLITSLVEETFMKNNVRMRVIGDRERLAPEVRKCIEDCEKHTSENTGLTLVIALSYSSRWEITDAMKHIAQKVKDGTLEPDDINEQTIAENLESHFMPDPELLIRTGGEQRISNYLLWQCAYSELYFTDIFWPDFDEKALYNAIEDYQHRERRFGKTSAQVKADTGLQQTV